MALGTKPSDYEAERKRRDETIANLVGSVNEKYPQGGLFT